MTPDQIAESQRMARGGCRATHRRARIALMTEQEFQELFRNLYDTVGLSETKFFAWPPFLSDRERCSR